MSWAWKKFYNPRAWSINILIVFEPLFMRIWYLFNNIAEMSSLGSDESAYLCSLARAFATKYTKYGRW